ncbi:MAG: 50S ribosomal protein L11 methyltransferase [Pseudomonadota bacterium]
MAWLRVTFPATAAELPGSEALLEALDAAVVTVLPQGDEIPWEPAPGELPQSSNNWVSALLALEFDAAALRERLAEGLTAAQLAAISVDFLADEDWSQSYRQFAVETCFEDRLWLLPREAPMRDGPMVRLDPGLAFGTGSHPTTRLCLGGLARQDLTAMRVLDYGCGSGVLAIAALALGAEQAWALDYDPQALVATRDNADYNGFSVATAPADHAALVVATPGTLPDSLTFDMIVANILANPLVELAPRLQALLRPGGVLMLAGLLEEQADRVAAAYPEVAFVASTDAHREGEWRLLEGRRR